MHLGLRVGLVRGLLWRRDSCVPRMNGCTPSGGLSLSLPAHPRPRTGATWARGKGFLVPALGPAFHPSARRLLDLQFPPDASSLHPLEGLCSGPVPASRWPGLRWQIPNSRPRPVPPASSRPGLGVAVAVVQGPTASGTPPRRLPAPSSEPGRAGPGGSVQAWPPHLPAFLESRPGHPPSSAQPAALRRTRPVLPTAGPSWALNSDSGSSGDTAGSGPPPNGAV